jgi:hypothetical protein
MITSTTIITPPIIPPTISHIFDDVGAGGVTVDVVIAEVVNGVVVVVDGVVTAGVVDDGTVIDRVVVAGVVDDGTVNVGVVTTGVVVTGTTTVKLPLKLPTTTL